MLENKLAKHWAFNLAIVFFAVSSDQLTKVMHLWIPKGWEFSLPIQINQYYNYGIFMGFLENSAPELRILTFSSLAGLLSIIFLLVNYVLSPKVIYFRIGLSFFFSGIMGNAIDRTFLGYVRDFITFDMSVFRLYAFNLADVWLFCGLVFTILATFYEDRYIFYPENYRQKLIIDAPFQLRMLRKACFLLGALWTTFFMFNYTFLYIVFSRVNISSKFYLETMNTFVWGSVLIFLMMVSIVGLMVLLGTHRIAGPLYSFERFINQLLSGKTKNFRIRDQDYLRPLVRISQKLQKHKK